MKGLVSVTLITQLLLAGCTGVYTNVSAETKTQASAASFNTLSLLGGETAKITVTRVEQSGKVDPQLVDILAVENQRGRELKKGVYQPSKLELNLHQTIGAVPGYGELVRALNPENIENARANAAFTLDYSRTTVNEVEFLKGKIRRSYFLELGMGFTLLDQQGRTVYATEVADYTFTYCIIEDGSACKDSQTASDFSLAPHWQDLLDNTMRQIVQSAYQGLEQWQNVLNSMAARVIVNKFGEELELQKNANYLRNKQIADYPYLFITVGKVANKRLMQGLRERGVQPDEQERSNLRGFATTLFRHSVDRQLRHLHAKSKSARGAGIFLIPEYGASWFQDAMARIVADSVNDEAFEEVMDEQGEVREQLIASARNYGKLCQQEDRRRSIDRCLELQVKYDASESVIAEDKLGKVESAFQAITASSVLKDPKINPKQDSAYKRFYPHGLPADQRILTVLERSPDYHRIRSESAAHNDDAIYLKIASLAAMISLGESMAESVMQTFREEL